MNPKFDEELYELHEILSAHEAIAKPDTSLDLSDQQAMCSCGTKIWVHSKREVVSWVPVVVDSAGRDRFEFTKWSDSLLCQKKN